jgi:hypothetical protein
MDRQDGTGQRERERERESFSGGRSQETRREPLTMGKQMVHLNTCGWRSNAPFL